MQAEKRTAYLIEGKPVFDVELRKKYTKRQMVEMEEFKIQVPRYPTLQTFDFDTGCCDTEQIYYEVLNSKLQEKEETMELYMGMRGNSRRRHIAENGGKGYRE